MQGSHWQRMSVTSLSPLRVRSRPPPGVSMRIPRPNRILLVGAVVVLVAAVLNAPQSSAEEVGTAVVPANDAARGLVYDGFKSGTGRCKGLLEVKAIPGACTHGPDAPFAGLDVSRSVP